MLKSEGIQAQLPQTTTKARPTSSPSARDEQGDVVEYVVELKLRSHLSALREQARVLKTNLAELKVSHAALQAVLLELQKATHQD